MFDQFKQNPEHFITEAARLINEQKATVIVEHLSYDPLADTYDTDIFTENQTKQDFSKAIGKLKKHIYDYVVTDSDVERAFVKNWTRARRSWSTPSCRAASSSRRPSATTTPTGRSPSRRAASSTSTSSPRPRAPCPPCSCGQIEDTKIECARKFFNEIGKRIACDGATYNVVTSYEALMQVVGRAA